MYLVYYKDLFIRINGFTGLAIYSGWQPRLLTLLSDV